MSLLSTSKHSKATLVVGNLGEPAGNCIKFSCLITVYAGTVPAYFQEAFFSIVNQSEPPSEIILVIDGPVSMELNGLIGQLQNDSELRLQVVRLEQNVGSGRARNIGVQHAAFEWVAVMDCDDYSLPTRFEEQLDVICRQPDVAIVATLSDEYLDDFKEEHFFAKKKCPETSDAIRRRLNYTCCITNPTIMFKKTLWSETGGFGSFKFLNEDHFFFLHAIKRGAQFYCVQKPLLKVRTGIAQHQRRRGWPLLLTDLKFRTYCFQNGLMDWKGFLVVVPLAIRRILPAFVIPYLHRMWRSV